jgi:sugar phosphate permease
MAKLKSRFNIFYGWWIVGGAVVTHALEGGLGVYCFGVFMPHLLNDFGWGRGQLSLAVTISSIAGGLSGPFVGKWVDRHGPRGIMTLGALVAGTSFALLSLTPSIWYFYIFYLIFALGRAGAGMVPSNTMVANWFREKRGLAIGIVATGIGWGGVIVQPLAAWLILSFGWRSAYVALGVASVLILTPLIFLLMRRLRPEEMGLLPDGKISFEEARPNPLAEPAETGPSTPTWTLGTAARTWTFRLIWLGIFVFYFGQASIIFHGVALFQERGASPQLAANLMSLVAFVGILGKVSSGYVLDKIKARNFALLASFLHVATLTVFLTTTGVPVLWLFAVLFGLALGSLATLGPMSVAQSFGRASFGAIYGTVGLATTVGVGLGPAFFGLIFDTTGSYNPALMLYIGTHILAGAMIFLARSPKPPVETAVQGL